MTRAVIALGSNLGERADYFAAALEALGALGSLRGVSDWFESIAHTPNGADPHAPRYLNGVALLDTELAPAALLAELHRIEAELGRVRGERWADRTLDLDLISYGEMESSDPELRLPHPRAAERAFVLAPWLDLDADATLPGLGRADVLLSRLSPLERAALTRVEAVS